MTLCMLLCNFQYQSEYLVFLYKVLHFQNHKLCSFGSIISQKAVEYHASKECNSLNFP